MNRRLFLARLSSLAAALGVLGVSGLALSSCSSHRTVAQLRTPIQVPEGLQHQLAHLADADFKHYAEQQEKVDLYATLLERGVFSHHGQYRENRLEELVRAEPLLEYHGFYYTQSELQLYALSYLLRQNHSDP